MCVSHLVANVARYVQVPLAANYSFIKPPQHLQRVAKVPAGFGFSEKIANGPGRSTYVQVRTARSINERNAEVLAEVLPGQGQVVAVELQGFGVVVQVKVSIAQLTVDGTQHLQVLCANLDGGLKERDARPVVTGFTEPLALQRQLQAGHLHPAAEKTNQEKNNKNEAESA